MQKLVVYDDGDEVLITTLEDEHTLLENWFGPDNRDLETFDRRVCAGVIEIKAQAKVSFDREFRD